MLSVIRRPACRLSRSLFAGSAASEEAASVLVLVLEAVVPEAVLVLVLVASGSRASGGTDPRARSRLSIDSMRSVAKRWIANWREDSMSRFVRSCRLRKSATERRYLSFRSMISRDFASRSFFNGSSAGAGGCCCCCAGAESEVGEDAAPELLSGVASACCCWVSVVCHRRWGIRGGWENMENSGWACRVRKGEVVCEMDLDGAPAVNRRLCRSSCLLIMMWSRVG